MHFRAGIRLIAMVRRHVILLAPVLVLAQLPDTPQRPWTYGSHADSPGRHRAHASGPERSADAGADGEQWRPAAGGRESTRRTADRGADRADRELRRTDEHHGDGRAGGVVVPRLLAGGSPGAAASRRQDLVSQLAAGGGPVGRRPHHHPAPAARHEVVGRRLFRRRGRGLLVRRHEHEQGAASDGADQSQRRRLAGAGTPRGRPYLRVDLRGAAAQLRAAAAHPAALHVVDGIHRRAQALPVAVPYRIQRQGQRPGQGGRIR